MAFARERTTIIVINAEASFISCNFEIPVKVPSKMEEQICINCNFRSACHKSFRSHDCKVTVNGKTYTGWQARNMRKCEYENCDFHSYNPRDIKRHVEVIHLKEKNYQCEYCEEKFSYFEYMKKHIKVRHLGLGEKCEICNKSVMDMSTHLRQHSNNSKKFKCEHCEKNFSQKSNLKKHVAKIHDGKTLK